MIRTSGWKQKNWSTRPLIPFIELQSRWKSQIQSAWKLSKEIRWLEKADQVSSKTSMMAGEFYRASFYWLFKYCSHRIPGNLWWTLSNRSGSKCRIGMGTRSISRLGMPWALVMIQWLRWKAAGEPAAKWTFTKCWMEVNGSFTKWGRRQKALLLIFEQVICRKSLESKISSLSGYV